MKILRFLYIALFAYVALSFTLCRRAEKIQPAENLRCEHLINPLGIDCAAPRFSWRLPVSENNAVQSAYQIKVSADSLALLSGRSDVWDSFKVLSDVQSAVYKGAPLQSFTKYFWTVVYYDKFDNVSCVSPVASFETAMMSASDWQGEWISDGKSKDYKSAPYFRKKFSADKKIKSARVYIAAAGLFELSVNGAKVSEDMLNPMFTCFDRRNLYVTNDVTSFLNDGHNVIGILLGNGWYNHQSTTVWHFDKASWRNRPRFMLNLRIKFEDGTVETIATDTLWKTTDSPIVFNSIYTAEHYDARKEIPGWDKPLFNDKSWKQAVSETSPSEIIIAQQLNPIQVIDTLKPVKMTKRSDKHYVFHFDRNIAGTIKIKADGAESTILRIRHAELLDKNDLPNMSNIDYHHRPTDDSDPFQTDIFILSGTKEDVFTPRFNYKGFQYVDVVSSKPINLTKESLIALEMHSHVPQAGTIHTSNLLLNKIWEAGNSSYLANLFGYPTDCPQREKNGWTGDAHIIMETALYNFDAITVYEKWMNDFIDMQRKNGVLPCIIPTSVWGFDWANGVDWTSAIAIVPWEIYKFYGDDRLLETMYDHIKLYVDHIASISNNSLTNWGLGDWIPVKTTSNVELTTSIYYYLDALILSKAAALLDKKEDTLRYTALSEDIKNAINEKFLNKETGIYASGTQTELSMPLFYKIVPENLRIKTAYHLYKKVEESNFHLDVGLHGSKALLNALSENGYADAAYKIVSQKTFPSWGYWIENGATTFFENWDTKKIHDNTHNHIMFGEVSAWFYKGLGGIISDENAPGFKHIILRPNFPEGLEHFEARHLSPYGWIVSKWKKEDGGVKYEATIPPNSRATLYASDGKKGETIQHLSSGIHSFFFEN